MSDRDLILILARVIVAAAWADGKLTPEEIDSLKDLLFRLPHAGPARGVQLPAREWSELELYMQSPVSAEERARLVAELQGALRTPADRALAREALESLVHADGIVSPEEEALVAEIVAALERVDLGLLARFTRLIGGPLRRRTDAASGSPLREAELEDFVKNRIYYQVRRLALPEAEIRVPDAELRKLSLATGLLARVAHVDGAVSADEASVLAAKLQTGWSVSEAVAVAVADVAVSLAPDLDYYRLTRELYEVTTDEERVVLFDMLFAVARADGQISADEIEEIRRIARSLNVSRQHVNDALDRARAGS